MTFMIGQKFPTDTVTAVMADGSINNNFTVEDNANGGYTVVFFYPKDFTFVCPTEIVAFDKAKAEFDSRNTKVIGVSIDSAKSHADWRNTALNEGGIEEINYPLVADDEQKWTNKLGIMCEEESVTYRASYLLDKDGIVRHMVINDLPLGRSITEMLRMVDALQFTEEHGEVCPMNWQKGEKAMSATTESTAEYLASKYNVA